MTLETILLAIGNRDDDRIDELIDTVCEIAEPLGATVIVAHVIPDDIDEISNTAVPIAGNPGSYILSQDEYADLLEEYPLDEHDVDDVVARHVAVQAIANGLADRNVEYEIRGVIGDPSNALVALADDLDVDRVVISGRHRSPTSKVVFGSVAQTILLESPCPVTFVRDE
ncbi:universal stress protein [Haloterrigena sp. SYSU A121-1]|uniref:Universal stress protein n=1 Tax=Haloterrigena gelatinilytica TaxID=2741724 RepID=A0A8J8GSN5_9EURY|nr:universal stress protein [Haloterrigena gelatinilytica]NUB93772.1 universal stress protein [Haloterrigena gelatinilytica]